MPENLTLDPEVQRQKRGLNKATSGTVDSREPEARVSANRRGVFKTREAADYLGMSVSSLTKWRMTGYGPKWIRVGPKAVRYRQEDLDAWLSENITTSTSEVKEAST